MGSFLREAAENNIKYFVLGGGTNLLFADEGYRGAIVKLSGDFERIEVKGEEIICGSAALLQKVLKTAIDNSLIGLEAAAGIPGTAGGAVFGNAGSFKKWIGEAVKSVEVYKNAKKELINKEKIGFQYRKSGLENCIITKISFSLKKEAENDSLKEVLENVQKRSKTQPLDMPNAGSIFKNPENLSAGKLIEDCGLKGKTVGGAQISKLHGNFIVNAGGAKSSDILKLIDTVKNEVKNKFGINLETEIKIIK